MDPLQTIAERLAGHRESLLNHSVYDRMHDLNALRRFMQYHAFAVWDFMSLLKALQRRLSCVSVPWVPRANHDACRLINEIVLAEESDEDGRGGFASHFELYRSAMRECGAETTGIDQLIAALGDGQTLSQALQQPGIPAAARKFVSTTFEFIDTNNPITLTSAFTFGREDLLPAVFQRIVTALNQESGGRLSQFIYYLERHIALDGDDHGPKAYQLLRGLCGDDVSAWRLAEETAVDSLRARQELWDAIALVGD